MTSALKNILEQAFMAGFAISAEGFNGEYGADNVGNYAPFIAKRDQFVSATLAAAPEAPTPAPILSGWQDISTAPIGQSVIICTWWKHSPSSAFRAEGFRDRATMTWRNQDGTPISADRSEPTHWQAIPQAPAITAEGE